MSLKTYLRSLAKDERDVFSARCGTTTNYMRLVAYGAKTPGESLVIAIERESSGAVLCEELRPDVDWAYVRGTAKRVTTKPTTSSSHPGLITADKD